MGHTRDFLHNNSSGLVHLVDVIVLIIHNHHGHLEGRLVTFDGKQASSVMAPSGDGGVLPADIVLLAQAVVFASIVLK